MDVYVPNADEVKEAYILQEGDWEMLLWGF